MKKGPWLAVALMAVAVVGLLIALAFKRGDDGPSATSLVRDAPAAVDAAGSAKLTMLVKVDTKGVDVKVDGTGAVDFGSGAGWFVVEMLGQRIEVRTDGTTLFVLPNGEKTWLAVNAKDAGALASFGAGPSSATALIDLLRGDHDKVEDLGHQTVGKKDARHLRMRIAAGKIPKELASFVPKGKDLPLEVWIDANGLPVRERLVGALQGLDVAVTLDLTSYGSELGVAIPPEGSTRDIEPDELTRVFGRPQP
jgi:hypothetical protein